MNSTDKKIEVYVKQHTTKEDDILLSLERKTNLCSVQPRMISGQVQGKILQMLVDMLKPKRVVEIGTFTGYSAICMARAMCAGSVLHSIDINDELSYIPEEYIEKAGVSDIVKLHIGSALDVIPEIGGKFDLVFMDGDKREYVEYYNMLMDGGYLESGSYILADNTLWDGKVADLQPKDYKDSYTMGIVEFNKMVVEDSRVEVVIVPFRDGMSFIKVL